MNPISKPMYKIIVEKLLPKEEGKYQESVDVYRQTVEELDVNALVRFINAEKKPTI